MREAIQVVRELLKGETVDFHGDVIGFTNGKLSFKPVRADIPVYVASNGPLGQRMTGAVADGAIMEGCGSVEEVKAFRAILAEGAKKKGRDPAAVKVVAAPQCLRRAPTARRRATACGWASPACWRRAG